MEGLSGLNGFYRDMDSTALRPVNTSREARRGAKCPPPPVYVYRDVVRAGSPPHDIACLARLDATVAMKPYGKPLSLNPNKPLGRKPEGNSTPIPFPVI